MLLEAIEKTAGCCYAMLQEEERKCYEKEKAAGRKRTQNSTWEERPAQVMREIGFRNPSQFRTA